MASLGDHLDVPQGVFDREHFISGADLLPTVLDYAGVDTPDGVQGESIRPLIEGKDVAWRDFAYVESNFWGRAIVTNYYKYVTEYRPKKEEDFVPPGPDESALGLEQLFDLENDPWEKRNLAGEPELGNVLADCRSKLLHLEAELNHRPLRERWADYDA